MRGDQCRAFALYKIYKFVYITSTCYQKIFVELIPFLVYVRQQFLKELHCS